MNATLPSCVRPLCAGSFCSALWPCYHAIREKMQPNQIQQIFNKHLLYQSCVLRAHQNEWDSDVTSGLRSLLSGQVARQGDIRVRVCVCVCVHTFCWEDESIRKIFIIFEFPSGILGEGLSSNEEQFEQKHPSWKAEGMFRTWAEV